MIYKLFDNIYHMILTIYMYVFVNYHLDQTDVMFNVRNIFFLRFWKYFNIRTNSDY